MLHFHRAAIDLEYSSTGAEIDLTIGHRKSPALHEDQAARVVAVAIRIILIDDQVRADDHAAAVRNGQTVPAAVATDDKVAAAGPERVGAGDQHTVVAIA